MNPDPNPTPPAPNATLILDHAAIDRCLKRIAHEIIERNPDLSKAALIGIPSRGVEMARRLTARSPAGLRSWAQFCQGATPKESADTRSGRPALARLRREAVNRSLAKPFRRK